MDETKIEQVEAIADEEVKAEEADAVEAEEVEAVEAEEAPAEEVEEAPAEEAPAEEAPAEEVAEGCEDKCDACKVKKETEDDEDEKKVAVKEGLQAKHDAKQREEVAKEQSKDLVSEELFDIASERVTDKVMEAIANLPIEEGMSEEDAQARQDAIIAEGQQLLADVVAVLEEMVNGTTVELNGAQVEVKDFVGKGGKVGMGLPAGINPKCHSENDESEKKVTIKAYHEGAEEIDYQAKYAESEALMDDLVATVENTATKYKDLVESYNAVVAELQAYKISESYGITVDDAADLLSDYSFEDVCEALEEYEANEMIAEGAEDKAEEADAEADDKEEKAEEKEEKKEEKKAEEQEKALEEIKESAQEEIENVEGAVIDESVEAPKIKAFSVFASNSISESKKARKAFSVFAD